MPQISHQLIEAGKQRKIVFDFIENVTVALEEYLLEERGVVGIIVNTVKRSQEIYNNLAGIYGSKNIRLLHSRFVSTDRAAKENELKNTIGKNGDRPEFRIIVGTQVLEQSLDIDFDLLITELSPIDLLLQRIGRLHRHSRDNRPSGMKNPRCLIIPADDNSKKIYGEYLLMRTEKRLQTQGGSIIIPKDVSDLVNDVYGDVDIKISDEEKYIIAEKNHKENHKERIEDKKSKALSFLLKEPKPSSKRVQTIDNMLDKGVESESAGLCAVRDTDPSIEVIVLKDSDNIDKNTCPDYETAVAIARRTIRLPRSLCGEWIIDSTINGLEEKAKGYAEWQMSPLLKGELFISFDENGQTTINGIKLNYNELEGLKDERLGEGNEK
jgi:CRISPR-associated endonuclease/helicase Cas3